jgi:flavodoxin
MDTASMDTPKGLVVYYSRSGTTRRLAQSLATALGWEIEELLDLRPRSGLSGYLRSLVEALRQRPGQIARPSKDPGGYAYVAVGTPVWASSVSSPVRAYLTEYGSRLRKTALFCTLGGSGAQRAFAQMQLLTGKTPEALLSITAAELAADKCGERLTKFVRRLQSGAAQEPQPAARAV